MNSSASRSFCRAVVIILKLWTALLIISGMPPVGLVGRGAVHTPPAPNQVLIKWQAEPGAARRFAQQQVQTLSGAKLRRSFTRLGWQLVELPEGMPVNVALEHYRALPAVAHVEPNRPVKLHAASSDPQMPKLWGLPKIGALEAWASLTNTAEIVVAVLDTGINYTHPDLAANMWRNPGEVPGNGRDDDNNGYVDDVYGLDVLEGDSDPMDIDGHGSHVAGTIGAVRNNGVGVAGVFPTAKLLAIRMLSSDTFSGLAQAVQAYEYAIALRERGVNLRVMNNSWGGDFPSFALMEAICVASELGIVSVCSAGNDHENNDFRPGYPNGYSCEGVLSVAASTPGDELASFSNYGFDTVHLAAPGTGILSTYKGKPDYGALSGTSMASPHVSGAAALLLSKKPDLTVAEVKSLLLSSVDRVPAWQNTLISGGRVNVAKALQQLASKSAPTVTNSTRRPAWLQQISRNAEGKIGGNDSLEVAVSDDGRFVAFTSAAENLVPNDTNGSLDVFLLDRLSGTLSRVSVSAAGRQADGDSGHPSVSADGRFVAFHSDAESLVAGEANGSLDVFVYDRVANRLELVSAPSAGGLGDGDSGFPSISGDGRYVVFSSDASNLVPDDFNGERDIFLRDRVERRTIRVSVPPAGGDGNGLSDRPAIARDGRFVAFHSNASNLVSSDSNNSYDVFVLDRTTGSLERVSVSTARIQGNNDSGFPSLSADGQFIVYQSLASNLTAGDSNASWDIFLRDRSQGLTRRVSAGNGGRQSDDDSFDPTISSDGRWIAFASPASTLRPASETAVLDLYIYDRLTDKLSRAVHNGEGLPGTDSSVRPKFSRDGSSLAFVSWAFNLVPGDGNASADIFMLDRSGPLPDLMVRRVGDSFFAGIGIRSERANQRISQPVALGSTAAFEFALENDGNAPEAFLISGSGNAAGWRVEYFDSATAGQSITVAATTSGWPTPVLQPGQRWTGRIEVTALSQSAAERVFAAQVAAKALHGAAVLDQIQAVAVRPFSPPDTIMASRARDGRPGVMTSEAPSISGDGRYVAFGSDAPTFVPGDLNDDGDVFVFDRQSENIERISATASGIPGNALSRDPSISADGRYVVFSSRSNNLVPNDTNNREDIFVKDRTTRTMTRVNVASNRAQATNGGSIFPKISGNGQFVVFHSRADNLVAGDTKQSWDVFVHERATSQTTCVSLTPQGRVGNGDSTFADVSFDGRYVAFQSQAVDLIAGDANEASDVFIYDRTTRSLELISVALGGGTGNGSSGAVSISEDGRYVLFTSAASNLVLEDRNDANDVFLFDRTERKMKRLELAVRGRGHALSPDGRWIGFTSDPSQLAAGGVRAFGDVFLYDLGTESLRRVSVTRGGGVASDGSEFGGFSRDGRFLVFQTWAQNLWAERTAEAGQILVFDQASFQPDQLVRPEDDVNYRGTDLFSREGQLIEPVLAEGSFGTVFGAIRNAGTFSDRFVVTVTNATAAALNAQYFDALDTNITEQINGPGWDTGELAPGATKEIRVVIAASASLATNSLVQLRAVSVNDPHKSDIVQIAPQFDSDNDRLPDVWERQHFGATTVTAGIADADGDGFPDAFEYVAGTDPKLATSTLSLSRPTKIQSAPIALRWPSVADRYYVIERSPALGQSFQAVSGLLLATPPENTFVDSLSAERMYFYRVRVLPP